MTEEQRWLSRRYLAYRLFAGMWFMAAVWLYFYRIFMTDQQVGILDSMAFAIGLLAEVPSGALADKFGRDRMVRLGQTLVAVGLVVQGLGNGFWQIFIGQVLLMVGAGFVSGADEALFYERLRFKPSSVEWRKLMTRGQQAALIAALLATVVGGWLHGINPRFTFMASGVAFMISVIAIWPVRDLRPKKERQEFGVEVRDYLNNITTGFKQFRLPQLRIYVPLVVTVQGLFYLTGMGILRIILLDRFHFTPFWGSVAVAVTNLITIGLLSLMHRNADRLSEKHVLSGIALLTAASLLLSVPNIGLWGFAVILALRAGEYTLQPFMSETLNSHAPGDQRATVLSVASFLKILPYVVLAPMIGILSTQGKLNYFLVGWAVLICAAVAYYLSGKRRDTKIALP